MRAATAVLLAALALCGGAAAAGAAQPRSTCQKLAQRGKDLAPNSKLVLVVRGNDETGRISGCLLPRGKVRTLASWDDGLSRDWSSVVRTAGRFVLVEDGHGDQYGGVSRSLTRVDVQHGRRLSLSGYGCQLGYSMQACPDGSSHGRVGMAATGAGAYELTDFATRTTTLQAFSPGGAFTKLADGAVDALRVTSAGIAWTQAGAQHTAPLPT
jgi:hypothetical protein